MYPANKNAIVSESLRGLVSLSNGNLGLLESDNVVYRKDISNSKTVKIISGGGSGHEPLHAGFVGRGGLTAAVCGNIFASPSTKQIINCINFLARDLNCCENGILVIVKNYTGDVLNFTAAMEVARKEGILIDMLIVADDAAEYLEEPDSNNSNNNHQRGLAGTLFCHKLLSALSEDTEKQYTLHELKRIGQLFVDNVSTLGICYESCTVPGNVSGKKQISENSIVLGLGIHGEPGMMTINPMPSLNELSSIITDRLSKKLKLLENESVAILINNLGALTNLEMLIASNNILNSIKGSLKLNVVRVFYGTYVTSLDMKGLSVSILVYDRIHKNHKEIDIDALLDFPMSTFVKFEPCANNFKFNVNSESSRRTVDDNKDFIENNKSFSFRNDDDDEDSNVRKREKLSLVEKSDKIEHVKNSRYVLNNANINNNSNKILFAVTKVAQISKSLKKLAECKDFLNNLDSKAGDGDCGDTIYNACCEINEELNKYIKKKIYNLEDDQYIISVKDLFEVLNSVFERSGGTIGSIASIFCSQVLSSASLSEALTNYLRLSGAGLQQQQKSRTLNDVLIPVVEYFITTVDPNKLNNYVVDWKEVAQIARENANATKGTKASAGRAFNVPFENYKDFPDAGAECLAIFFEFYYKLNVARD